MKKGNLASNEAGLSTERESGSRKSAQDDKSSFCLTAGRCALRNRRDHAKTTTRNHTPGFKAKVTLPAIRVSEQWFVWATVRRSPNQVTAWKAQLEGGSTDVLDPGGGDAAAQPVIDVNSLHAKIGGWRWRMIFWKARSAEPACSAQSDDRP